MSKKYLVVGCLLTVLIATVVVYSLRPTFESELEYYREYTTNHLSGAEQGHWVIRDVANEPQEYLVPGEGWTHLSSFWDIKNYSETYSGMYGAEAVFIESTHKEVRETVALYKAVYIWYDSNERIIWAVAPGEHIWSFPYWIAP